MPVSTLDGDAADSELRALLQQLKTGSGLTYESLGEQAVMSRGAAQNYITRHGHRRHANMLEQLLEALGASAQVRDRALELHRRTLPTGLDPAEVGWAARARAAECTVWTMAGFTATEAAVHTAIGRGPVSVSV